MFPFATPWNLADLSPSELDGMLREVKAAATRQRRGRKRG